MITLLSYKNGEIIVPIDTAAQLFYQDHLSTFQDVQTILANELERMRSDCIACAGRDPVDHWSTRVKSAASTQNKLERLGLPVSAESTMEHLHDVIGMWVICAYVDDIYLVRKWFGEQSSASIVEERDYVRQPKENGYRSFHLILRLDVHQCPIMAELQLRTLAMDCWASLEHQLKYKSDIKAHRLITSELKRCADEIASTDWNLMSIRDMMKEDMQQQKEIQHEDTAR